MNIFYSKLFKKQYKKQSHKIQFEFSGRVKLYLENSTSSKLNVHKLHGKYIGLWSINISGDVRAIVDRSVSGDLHFIEIGSHSKLYS